MINRAVLNNPDLIDTMDLFNDGKDTRDWLRGMGRPDLAERIQERLNTKSFLVRQAATTMGLDVVDIPLASADDADLKGLPHAP